MTRILEIRSGRIRTHDKDFGDPNYNQLNYTPLTSSNLILKGSKLEEK